MTRADTNAIPTTVLTGFLGAGKTTLLNRILNGNHGLRAAVLVNDFGSINIDAELVVGVESDVISLANGCVCCSIRSDLLEAVMRVLDRPEHPEYVLLEASGVADPAGILVTFNDEALCQCIRLDNITCVVDAEQVFAYQDQPFVVRLKMMQIACADMTILNKVDLAGPEQVARVREWLGENFGRLRVFEASHCEVPLELLLGSGRFGPVASVGDPTCEVCGHAYSESHSHDHGSAFATWSFETTQPVYLGALKEMVRRELPASVFRCKGIVYAAEAPAKRAILQTVGRRTDVLFGDAWADIIPRTRIVAIGAPGALNASGLRTLFESCLAPGGGIPGVSNSIEGALTAEESQWPLT